MVSRHVIVDGSNLATEGRSTPSLAQLDQAVREFIADNPDDSVTVVVDASFGHRIDPSEVADFEAAELAGEVVSPPAGAIGRGDAFLLRIAEKTGATVLSNDSFQEFHAEHPWVFEKGRLVGGKPVPGVGWIFMDRTPVRGPKSREVVKEAKKRKGAEEASDKAAGDRAAGDRAAGDRASGGRASGGRAAGDKAAGDKGKARAKAVDRAIARATQEVVEPKASSKSRRRRGGLPPAEPVNEPLAFITFIADHPLGSEVLGVVTEYSSHGAFVEVERARCYVPLSAMADPPPRRAREAVTRGETHPFVVQAFDPPRRGIELAVPGFAQVAGAPTPETVEAEITEQPAPKKSSRRSSKKTAPAAEATKKTAKRAPAQEVPAQEVPAQEVPAQEAPPQKSAARKSPARKSPTAARKVAKSAPAKKAAKATKVTKAAKAIDSAVAAKKAVKSAVPAKKATKATKATKTARATKTAKAAKATKAAKAAVPPKKATRARESPTPTTKPAKANTTPDRLGANEVQKKVRRNTTKKAAAASTAAPAVAAALQAD